MTVTATSSRQSRIQSACANGLDQQVLNSVVDFAPDFWAKLHRAGRAPELSRDTRDRLHQLLGAFPGMWALLLQHGTGKFANADERRELYRQALEASNARHTLARDMCTFLGVLASRQEAIGAEGTDELDTILSDGFWGLIGTGVFGQVPGTFRNPKVFRTSLERYCEALRSFWSEASRFVENPEETPEARALVQEIMDLAIFQGIRKQENSRIGKSSESLIRWYQGQDVQAQRSFYADVALGIHEVGQVREQVLRTLTLSPAKDRWSCRRARTLIEKHTMAIVLTGILAMVPA